MPGMNENLITRLEARLENLVEGTFSKLFRNTLTAHDVAIALVRSMEDHVLRVADDDPRLVAPDQYILHVHPAVAHKLQQHQADLLRLLREHLVEMVAQANYRMASAPHVSILPDEAIAASQIAIQVTHTARRDHSTAIMQPIARNKPDTGATPYLFIDGERTVPLTEPHLNIGRSDANHIVLDDPFVSRHHVQIRSRFGQYLLFDVDSRSGTFVNNVRVREHQLQPGDIIQIGNSRIIYMVDQPPQSAGTHTTQSLDPVDL